MYVKLLLISIFLIATNARTLDEYISAIFNSNINDMSPVTEGTATDHSVGGTYKKCGKRKRCVFEYLCNNGVMNTNGDRIRDIRSADFTDDDTLDVEDDTLCPFLETCCSFSNKSAEQVDDTDSTCGYRNVNGVGFEIEEVNDRQTKFAEFPWMVGICVERNVLHKSFHVYHCGGSLITPQVVLTAAHCVYNMPPNSFNARAGEWNSSNKNELYPHQDRKVVDMIVHEQFNEYKLHNDIALLFLDSPFELLPNVNTVCLPPANLSFDLAHCYVTGWGKDRYEHGSYQNILKKIDLPIVQDAQCQKNYKSILRYFTLHSSFLCAGGERGKDSCTGDGGSPLVCPISGTEDRFFQAGIVAGGYKCGLENIPGLYASVPRLREWIDKQLANRRIGSKTFTP